MRAAERLGPGRRALRHQRVERGGAKDIAEPERSTTSSPSRQPTRGEPPASEKTPKSGHGPTLHWRRAGLRTVGACEPRQIRKEAALSIPFQVCGSPGPFFSSDCRPCLMLGVLVDEQSGDSTPTRNGPSCWVFSCSEPSPSRRPSPGGSEAGAFLLESFRGRALPEIPPADLRRGRRPGGGRPDAEERDHGRTGAPGLSLRRPARHRQDLDGADPREEPELRARPDGDARRHVPRVRRDRRGHVARRDRDGCGVAARHRRHPRDPRPRRAAAGRGPLQGLHPRRGAPADGRRVERAPEADRGAAAASRLRLLHHRSLEGAADRALALPDVRLPAAAPAGPRHRADARRRGREDRRAAAGAVARRARSARLVPRRDLDARPARRRDRGDDHGAVGAAAARHRRGGGALPALRPRRRPRHRGRAHVRRGAVRAGARSRPARRPS